MLASRELTAARGSAIPLRVEAVTDAAANRPVTIHCTDVEGTELRMTLGESPPTERPWETGEWYRFDGVVRSDSLGPELLFPVGDGEVAPIDAPEERTHPQVSALDDPWLIQSGASQDRLAVTVQPRPTENINRVRAADPETFEIGAVCLASCDGPGEPTVYHREEADTRDEHLLLEHVVEDLSAAAGATLVTRERDPSPLELLSRRLAQASGGGVVPTDAERVLDGCFHATPESAVAVAEADTLAAAAEGLGVECSPVTFDDYELGVDPTEWRESGEADETTLSDASDPRMTDRDYATLVEWYLGATEAAVDSTHLARCLKAYASADLTPLCALATHEATDRVACRRLSGSLLER